MKETIETANRENQVHSDLQQPKYDMQRHVPFHPSERSERSLVLQISTSVTDLDKPKSMQNLPAVISPRQQDYQQNLPDSFIVPLVLKLTNMRKLE